MARLLMRLLALACIILAFAEPVREASAGAANSGVKSVSVYLDTSPSMQLEGANGPLLAASQSGALALVESHGPTDRFHIFTSACEPEDRRFRSREEALERIAAIRPGHAAPPIGDVLRHQQDVLAEGGAGRTEAYLFTDLQASGHVGLHHRAWSIPASPYGLSPTSSPGSTCGSIPPGSTRCA